MTRWIRWKGFLAFAVAVLVIVLIWMLVVDAVVRRSIEIAGSRAVGARVDLAKADLSLFPSGLELTGLAVTNPESPMRNAVEIGRLKMDLDPGYLIRRKVIIGDLVMEGLRFDTPRKRSGELPGRARKKDRKVSTDTAAVSKAAVEKVCGEFSMPSLSQPDVRAILARESLESVKLATDLEQKLRTEEAYWEKELTRLADEKTIEDYEKRIDRLKGAGGSLGNLLGATGDVLQLQKDINRDLSLLKKAQTTLGVDIETYRQQVKALSLAPRKDIDRLMKKYSLTAGGLANLSQLIFGERLCAWVGTIADGYRRIQPYIAKIPKGKPNAPEEKKPLRGKGTDIRFAETPPMPDFLIRSLKVDAQLTAGDFTGKAENITLDQRILGSPTTFAFLGRKMQRIDSVSLIGSANYVKPEEPKNNARLAIKGLGLKDLILVREESFPLTLQRAKGNLNLDLAMTGNMLDAAVKADFRDVKFISDAGGQQTDIAKAITDAISGVDRFALSADVAGTVETYTVDVKSDLDKVLKSAVGNLVKAESTKFQASLKEKITAELQGPLAKARGNLAGLDAIEAEIEKRLDLGGDLMKGLKLPF